MTKEKFKERLKEIEIKQILALQPNVSIAEAKRLSNEKSELLRQYIAFYAVN